MKIDIIGSFASGKTTLAKEISNTYGVPFYEKDNIVWARTLNGDQKRSNAEIDRIFRTIISEERKKIIESLSKYGTRYRKFANSEQAKKFIFEQYR